MKCIIKKIFRPDLNDGGGLRTETIEGETNKVPTIGECFCMTAEPLDPLASVRVINTSKIVNMVLIDDGYRVQTMSGSTYEIIFPKTA